MLKPAVVTSNADATERRRCVGPAGLYFCTGSLVWAARQDRTAWLGEGGPMEAQAGIVEIAMCRRYFL